MGNTTARNLPLYRTLLRRESKSKGPKNSTSGGVNSRPNSKILDSEANISKNSESDVNISKDSNSEVKIARTSDEETDDVFDEEIRQGWFSWRRNPQTVHRVELILTFSYCMTVVGGGMVVILVPLVQLFKSPRRWCREPLLSQDSTEEFCWLDLVQRTFPLTLTDAITFSAGLASFILGFMWFCCKSWRGKRQMWVVSLLLLIVFLTEVFTSISIAIMYSKRQTYLPIELRKSIKQELYQSIREYDVDPEILETWDIVQRSWCCCGVLEPVDWRNYRFSKRIPDSCKVLDRPGRGFSCYGYPWSHTVNVKNPKYYEEEGIYTTSRGCFELFAKRVGIDYVEAINIGWKVLLGLSFLQVFGIIAPVLQACWGNPSREIIESCATEMTLAPSPSIDSSLYINNRMKRQPSRQMSRPVSRPTGPPSVSFSVGRQDSQQLPSAPPETGENGRGLQVC
jgi:hypothetical protein